MSLSDHVETMMLRLGATPEYIGYKYLLAAILQCIRDETLLFRVTTVLYPRIALDFGTTPANVERGIRTVIGNIWNEADREELTLLMGRRYPGQPGNARFIGVACKRLLLEYRRLNPGRMPDFPTSTAL